MKPIPTAASSPDVPKGTVKQMPPWESKIFDGTKRDWWVYVPAQYRPENPAAVMVFQDGAGPEGLRADRLRQSDREGRHAGDASAIFIKPGIRADGGANRSFEYDTLSDQYARFLLEEILPEVEKTVKLRHDAASRAISGAAAAASAPSPSHGSGPNEFSKVLSWIGSFTNIAAGQDASRGRTQLRGAGSQDAAEANPFASFLQDGANDLDNANGNWPLANQTLAKSLAFAGYDYKFELGPRLPQQPARPRHSARLAALAVARLSA